MRAQCAFADQVGDHDDAHRNGTCALVWKKKYNPSGNPLYRPRKQRRKQSGAPTAQASQ